MNNDNITIIINSYSWVLFWTKSYVLSLLHSRGGNITTQIFKFNDCSRQTAKSKFRHSKHNQTQCQTNVSRGNVAVYSMTKAHRHRLCIAKIVDSWKVIVTNPHWTWPKFFLDNQVFAFNFPRHKNLPLLMLPFRSKKSSR